MDILHKKFQEKNSHPPRPSRTGILEKPSNSNSEATTEKRGDNEVDAFEAFKASQKTRLGQNSTASESDRPLLLRSTLHVNKPSRRARMPRIYCMDLKKVYLRSRAPYSRREAVLRPRATLNKRGKIEK